MQIISALIVNVANPGAHAFAIGIEEFLVVIDWRATGYCYEDDVTREVLGVRVAGLSPP